MSDIKNRLFAQLAVDAGFVSKSQLAECEEELEKTSRYLTNVPPLHELLHQKGYITHEQLDHIVRNIEHRDTRRFGEIALALGFINETQLNQALDMQAALHSETKSEVALDSTGTSSYSILRARVLTFGEVPKVGEILKTLGFLKPHQVSIVLREQHKVIAVCKMCGASLIVPNYVAGNRKISCGQCGTALRALGSEQSMPTAHVETVIDEEVDSLIGEIDEGFVFADFAIAGILGVDSSGLVCKASRLSDDTPVSLKLLNNAAMTDETFRERFFEDSIKLSRFEHPNIQKVLSVGKEEEGYHVVAEYVEADTARRFLEREIRFPSDRALKIAIQAGEALTYAHSRGVIHGGLKPSNILLLADDSIKVTNLGFARNSLQHAALIAKSGAIPPFFIAPEQVLETARADQRTDVYLLSATLYFMLSGRPPYDGKSPLEVMLSIVKGSPTPLAEIVPEIPSQLWTVIEKALHPDPDERYQNMEVFVGDLKKAPTGAEMAADKKEPVEVRRAREAFAAFEKELERRTPAEEKLARAETLSDFVKELRKLEQPEIYRDLLQKYAKKLSAKAAEETGQFQEERLIRENLSSLSEEDAQFAASLLGIEKPRGPRQIALAAEPRSRIRLLASVVAVAVLAAALFTIWGLNRNKSDTSLTTPPPADEGDGLAYYKGQMVTQEQLQMLYDQELMDFDQSQIEKGLVNFQGKWVTPEQRRQLEYLENLKRNLELDGKVEYKGRWVTPREREASVFKERMSDKGYVWKEDRWIPQELVNSLTPQLPPPPQNLPPPEEKPVVRISPPVVELSEIICAIESGLPTIRIRGASNLPPGIDLIGNFSYPLRPDNPLFSARSSVSTDGAFEIRLALEPTRDIKPCVYLVDVLFEPKFQFCRVENEDGSPPERTTVSSQLLIGDIESLERELSDDIDFMEVLLSESEKKFGELGETFKKCMASSPPAVSVFAAWSGPWKNRIDKLTATLNEYESIPLIPYFPSTAAALRTYLTKLLELNSKYVYCLSNKQFEHVYDDKYLSPQVAIDTYRQIRRTFEAEKSALAEIIRNYKKDR